MAKADWNEIKRLAADFQQAQASSTLQRLSDRNCIEIVQKLIELKLLDVTFTTDGKEYVTPQHISREIQDELYVRRGRADLVELADALKVSLQLIETKCNELVKVEKDLHLVLGQILNDSYLDRLAEEVNETLQQKGQVAIAELAKQYDLPGDFLQKSLEKRLGTIIRGQRDASDPRMIFNENYLSGRKAWLLGLFTALTKPTPVSNILMRKDMPERLFFNVVDSLISSKRIRGTLAGGRQANQAVFIPFLYSKAQNQWVQNFYAQNGYLEYDNLVRLGITDPKGYVKRKYPDEKLLMLSSCCMGKGLMEQIEGAVEEALASGMWVDILPLLPSVFDAKDSAQLLQELLKDMKFRETAHVFCDTVVVSDRLVQIVGRSFDSRMQQKAEADVASGAFVQNQIDLKLAANKNKVDTDVDTKREKHDNRRKKAAGGKSGGGTQGRETKTKSTKKKYRARNDSDSDDDEVLASSKTGKGVKTHELHFMTVEEIEAVLRNDDTLQEAGDELFEELAAHYYVPLTKRYQEVAKSVFEASMASNVQSRRKTHTNLQEKISGLLASVRHFDKGLKQFPVGEVQQALAKHLLKTLCTEIVNGIFVFVAQENMLQGAEDKELTAEMRVKLINGLPENMQEDLLKLHKSLGKNSVEDFLACLDGVLSSSVCDMVLKKTDKKKEKQMTIAHRLNLIEQLSASNEPALILHLAVTVLFQTCTQCMLHASGKFVPHILSFLQTRISADAHQFLSAYQGLVIQQLSHGIEEDALREVKRQLEELTPKVKDIAVTTKKNSAAAAGGDAE